MSEDQLKALLDKVATDTELQAKLYASESADAAIVIAKVAGISTTAVNFQSMLSAPVEVRGEDLRGTAGYMRCHGTT